MVNRRDHGSGLHPIRTTTPPAIRAVVVAARQHKLLDDAGAQRLTAIALNAGVAQVADWRTLLGSSLTGVDTGALLRLLPQTDETFGSYQPLAHLANGGMGAVWLTAATDGLNLAVLKYNRLDAGQDAAAQNRIRQRFTREANLHRQLHHPNVLRCLDVGITNNNHCYMVLEYSDGGDLADLVARCGPLPETVTLHLIYQVVDGLSEAHRLRLIHRDIKPGNIFLGSDGTAKLSDFGIARQESDAASQFTQAGTVLGSPYYLSPEQVNAAADIDIRSDIYAIGGLLCFCLSGHPPYPGSAMESMRRHATAPPPDLRQEGITLSDNTAAIIARCMAKDRAQRYADPLELRAALAQARSEVGTTDVRAWMAGESLAAVVDLNETLRPNQVLGVEAGLATPTPRSKAGSAIVFREPEEILALLAARNLAPGSAAIVTQTHEARQTTDELKAMPPPRRLPTEPLVPRWLTLTAGGNHERVIHLYGQESITLGKMAKPPVDLTALIYPIDINQAICNRISRIHCALKATPDGYTVTDLKANNGTMLNGRQLAPETPTEITNGSTLVLAQALELALTLAPRRNLANLPEGMQDSRHDALVITRPGNRQGLAYALVQRCLLVGGVGCDITLPGFPAGCGLLVVWTPDGWLQRLHVDGHPPGSWTPMAVGRSIGHGSQCITVQLGDYALLTQE